MADAVGARQAFFSPAAGSLSVKAAMLAVAGGQGDLLIQPRRPQVVIAGLVFGGVQPQWIRPRMTNGCTWLIRRPLRTWREPGGTPGRRWRADSESHALRDLRRRQRDCRYLPPAGESP